MGVLTGSHPGEDGIWTCQKQLSKYDWRFIKILCSIISIIVFTSGRPNSTEIQAAKNHRYATPLGVRSSSSRKEVRPLPHRKPKCCAFFKCPSVAASAKVPKKRKKRGRSREKTIPLNLPDSLSEKSILLIPTCSIRLGIDMDWSSCHEIWAKTPKRHLTTGHSPSLW